MSDCFVVKGYKLLTLIEEKSISTIFKALHIKSSSIVFLTLIELKPGKVMELLKKRAKQSMQLKLKSLVSAVDYGEYPTGFYYTQEAKATLTLQRVLDEVSEEEKRSYLMLGYFIKLLNVIEYLHLAKTTHRDLNTHSLRLDENENLFVEGFINARPKMETKGIVTMVELPYIAPEVLLGKPVDKKTDIYSLGIILFELLTGHLPYTSNFAKIEDAKRGAIPLLHLNSVKMTLFLENFLLRSLGSRNTRYNNCREWLNDMELVYKQRPLSLKIKDFSKSIRTLIK